MNTVFTIYKTVHTIVSSLIHVVSGFIEHMQIQNLKWRIHKYVSSKLKWMVKLEHVFTDLTISQIIEDK